MRYHGLTSHCITTYSDDKEHDRYETPGYAIQNIIYSPMTHNLIHYIEDTPQILAKNKEIHGE